MHACFDECNEGEASRIKNGKIVLRFLDMKILSQRNGGDWVNNESAG